MTSDHKSNSGIATWSTDEALPPPDWIEANREALTRLEEWRQGDLVTDIAVTWLLPQGEDQLTGLSNLTEHEAPAVNSDLVIPGAVVASQTCDIAFTPPGNKHPFVLLAPLVRESSLGKGTLNAARSGDVGYLVQVNPSPARFTQESWFADLRILVPASKSLLMTREPTRAFASEEQAWHFAELLGHKFRRPAVHSVLSEGLRDSMDNLIKGTGRNKPTFTKVEQVRLHVSGDRLAPQRVQLYVLELSPLTDAEKETWNAWEPKVKALLTPHGISLAPTIFISPHDMRAVQYRGTIPLQLRQIRSQPYW